MSDSNFYRSILTLTWNRKCGLKMFQLFILWTSKSCMITYITNSAPNFQSSADLFNISQHFHNLNLTTDKLVSKIYGCTRVIYIMMVTFVDLNLFSKFNLNFQTSKFTFQLQLYFHSSARAFHLQLELSNFT